MWIIVGLILVGLLLLFVADKVGLPMGKGTGYQAVEIEEEKEVVVIKDPAGKQEAPKQGILGPVRSAMSNLWERIFPPKPGDDPDKKKREEERKKDEEEEFEEEEFE